MKQLFVIQFIFLTTVLFAQSSSDKNNPKCSLGFYAGINIPKLSDGSNNQNTQDYTSRQGEGYGMTFSWAFSSRFSLRVDALYSSEGGKRNGMQAVDATSIDPSAPSGTFVYANYKNESILNYFEVPVMVKYSIPMNHKTKFYTNLGPYVGFLLNSKQKTSGTSLIYADKAGTMPLPIPPQSFDATTSTTDSVNPVNFGVTGGIGLAKTVGKGDVLLDVRGAYGLSVVQKNASDGQSHSGYLLIALGYAFHL